MSSGRYPCHSPAAKSNDMRDINEIMPKIPGMRWGAVTNLSPTIQNLKQLNAMLPHDTKWHKVLNTKHSVIVDDIPIVKKSRDSMT